jgi:hypothetical protein
MKCFGSPGARLGGPGAFVGEIQESEFIGMSYAERSQEPQARQGGRLGYQSDLVVAVLHLWDRVMQPQRTLRPCGETGAPTRKASSSCDAAFDL